MIIRRMTRSAHERPERKPTRAGLELTQTAFARGFSAIFLSWHARLLSHEVLYVTEPRLNKAIGTILQKIFEMSLISSLQTLRIQTASKSCVIRHRTRAMLFMFSKS